MAKFISKMTLQSLRNKIESALIPTQKGIPVLMYHDLIGPNEQKEPDFLKLKLNDFEAQLTHLKANGYHALSLEDFVAYYLGRLPLERLPQNPILLTFDDGYRALFTLALPILKKTQFSATLFVTTQYIEDREKNPNSPYLSIQELREWQRAGMSLGLHSHSHPNYKHIAIDAILQDLKKCELKLENWGIPHLKALAYPYGARPKSEKQRHELMRALSSEGIQAAFRIGNRIEPFLNDRTNVFDLNRIDIRGDDPQGTFEIKLKKGRVRLF